MTLPAGGASDDAGEVPAIPVEDLVLDEDVGRIHPLRQLLAVIASNSVRMAIFLIGWLLVLAGAIMLVLPGPGLVVIIAGFAVLAREFVWAERLLDMAKAHASKAKDAAGGALRRRRSARSDDAS
jgi:uncharacterized protein (TIGR02611 family)